MDIIQSSTYEISRFFVCIRHFAVVNNNTAGTIQFRNEDYSNLYTIYFEYHKVIAKTCDIFGTSYHQKPKLSAITVKGITENVKNFGSVRAKV